MLLQVNAYNTLFYFIDGRRWGWCGFLDNQDDDCFVGDSCLIECLFILKFLVPESQRLFFGRHLQGVFHFVFQILH